MKISHLAATLAGSLLIAPAWAQSSNKPLDLRLPPSSVLAASATTATPHGDAPGVYYGDTSGRMGNTEPVAATTRACDDASYNQPQVHGSVGVGVMGGNHMSGNIQTGTVNLSQAFGSCDDPGGGVSISISGERGNFHGRGR